jgi:hypothetical protein
MIYTKRLFAAELLVELERGLVELEPAFDPIRIGQWAYKKFLHHTGKMQEGLSDKMMQIALLEEGPEFEMSIEEIRTFAMTML